MKKVKDFMNRRVVYFSPGNTIREISEKFAECNISGAPIVEGGKLVGIVSSSDIIKFVNERLYKDVGEVNANTCSLITHLAKPLEEGGKLDKRAGELLKTRVSEIMTKNVKCVGPEDDMSKVAEEMIGNDINRVPVVENGKLVGIVARNDLIRALR